MGVGEWVAGSGLDQSRAVISGRLTNQRAGLARYQSRCGEIQGPCSQSRGRLKPCMHPRIHASTHPHMQAGHASHGSGDGEGKKVLVVLALVFPCQ